MIARSDVAEVCFKKLFFFFCTDEKPEKKLFRLKAVYLLLVVRTRHNGLSEYPVDYIWKKEEKKKKKTRFNYRIE